MLSQQSSLVRMIYASPGMTADDKRRLIDTIYYRMIELAKAGNQALDQLDAAGAQWE